MRSGILPAVTLKTLPAIAFRRDHFGTDRFGLITLLVGWISVQFAVGLMARQAIAKVEA